MIRAYVDPQLCKECLRCIRACPANALHLSETRNRMGYRTVDLTQQRCTGCGICYTVCPDCCFEIGQEVNNDKPVDEGQ